MKSVTSDREEIKTAKERETDEGKRKRPMKNDSKRRVWRSGWVGEWEREPL